MRTNIEDKKLYADLKGQLEVFARALPSPPRRIGIGLRDYAGYWLSAYVYVLRFHPLARLAALGPRVSFFPNSQGNE